jgi:subtilase family serine protease
MRTHLRAYVLGASAAALVAAAVYGPAAANAHPSDLVQIPNSAYTLIKGETDLGAPYDWPVRLTLSLNTRNQAQTDALAKAISTPGNPKYGHYLSAWQINALNSPSESDARAVTSWLKGAGFTITYNPSNHLIIDAVGTIASADKAFHSDFHVIQGNADEGGFIFNAPLTPLFVPAQVNSAVDGFIDGFGTAKAKRLSHPLNSRQSESKDLAKNARRATSRAKTTAAAIVKKAATITKSTSSAPPDAAFVNATPCSIYWGEKSAAADMPAVPSSFYQNIPYAPCGYTPAQLRGAYGVSSLTDNGLNGRGVRVAIIDAYNSPTVLADANQYAVLHGGKAFRNGQWREVTPPNPYTLGYDDQVNGDLCGEQGWYGEETLDVEAVHSMAPGAGVTYVGAASCNDNDLLTALNQVVDGHLADIVSNSWGSTGETTDPLILSSYHAVFVQAALKGIGVFFSSGDNGDEVDTTGVRQPDYPAVDPWVTGVGGTSIGIGKNNNYLFETGWGTTKSSLVNGAWSPAPADPAGWLYGAGGGTSSVFAQPWYQKGVVPSSLSKYNGGAKARVVPDIGAIADPSTGFLVGQTQTFPDGTVKYSEYRIGGTSLASPVMAGIEALADQAAGHAHGFANPAIYDLAGSRALHDVVDPAKIYSDVRSDYINGVDGTDGVKYSLRVFNQTESLHTIPGYDDVTGVGTPKGARFVFGLGH